MIRVPTTQVTRFDEPLDDSATHGNGNPLGKTDHGTDNQVVSESGLDVGPDPLALREAHVDGGRPGVTDTRRSEIASERLPEEERSAHEQLANVDEFVASLGHELRNPLSEIVSAVHVLELSHGKDLMAVEMLGVRKRQSLHMTRLVDELLDVSRIRCGKLLLKADQLDLGALARSTVADYRRQLEFARLTVNVEIPDAPIRVRGDAPRLSQVIGNLLHNAAKFTDPGGMIHVRVQGHAASVSLSVRDTGVGMLAAEMAGIFELYRQAESSQLRSQGGLGIGLALSRRIIAAHGGTITATSDGLGCGSVFRIELPLDGEPMQEPARPATGNNLKPPVHRILIVDDRRDARLTLSVLLQELGQQVTEAATGAAALDAARSLSPQIVLCDIGLPDMDEHAVARAIRTNPNLNRAFLVALTGYDQPADRVRAREAGFDRHLT